MTIFVKPEGGQLFDSMGDTMRFKLTGKDTNNEYTLIEDTIKPGFHATLHLHRQHTETFYVSEGEISFTVGRQTMKATPGAVVHVPCNTPHEACATHAGKMLTIFNPAGLENAIAALQNMTPEQLHDAAFFAATMAQHDIIDLTPAPIPQLLKFYDSLLVGDADALLGLFEGEPYINAPQSGEMRGEEAFRAFVAEQQKWLTEYSAEPNFFNIVITPERVVVELVIDVVRDGEKLDLPVALAFERSGDKITAVRIYHSTWLLTGGHSVRSPVLSLPALKPTEPAVIGAYMAALEEPNESFILSLFTEDGYVREPSGSRYRHAGAEARQNFYRMVMGQGGVMLRHCAATYDGSSFAVEYICDEWGKTKLPPQAGLAVYDLAGASKISAVRIYDDIQPPFEG